jgi:phosphate transport system substrate-binding protein
MKKSKDKNIAWLPLPSLVLLLVFSLLWSVGLVGKGLWQLAHQSDVELDRLRQSAPKSFSQVPNVATGSFKYGGSTVWASLRLSIDSAIQAERPEFRLQYVQSDRELPGTRAGIRMLIEDRLAFAQTSSALEQEERDRAARRGIELRQIPVAVDGIAIAVNPSLNLPGLTLEQLRAIYTGEIVNWREVGGPDLEIIPYTRPTSTGGTVRLFQNKVLKGQEFDPKVKLVSTTTKALRKIAGEPGAIYYASAPAIVLQCTVKALPLAQEGEQFIAPYQEPQASSSSCPNRRNKINFKAFQTAQYPLTNYLYVVIKENGSIDEQVGRAYANFLLTSEGQELIAKAGFVPIR